MPSLNLFLNLVFEQELFLRDFRLVRGINLRDLRSLCFGQWSDRRSFLQTFHREFIGRFHRYKESSKLDGPQSIFMELTSEHSCLAAGPLWPCSTGLTLPQPYGSGDCPTKPRGTAKP